MNIDKFSSFSNKVDLLVLLRNTTWTYDHSILVVLFVAIWTIWAYVLAIKYVLNVWMTDLQALHFFVSRIGQFPEPVQSFLFGYYKLNHVVRILLLNTLLLEEFVVGVCMIAWYSLKLIVTKGWLLYICLLFFFHILFLAWHLLIFFQNWDWKISSDRNVTRLLWTFSLSCTTATAA